MELEMNSIIDNETAIDMSKGYAYWKKSCKKTSFDIGMGDRQRYGMYVASKGDLRGYPAICLKSSTGEYYIDVNRFVEFFIMGLREVRSDEWSIHELIIDKSSVHNDVYFVVKKNEQIVSLNEDEGWGDVGRFFEYLEGVLSTIRFIGLTQKRSRIECFPL